MNRLVFLCALALCATAQARPPAPVDQLLESAPKVALFHQVAISPDGRWIAWTEATLGPSGPIPDRNALYVVDRRAAKAAPRLIAAPGRPANAQDPVWSPDGASLAFLSDAASPHQPELYVAAIATGRVRKLTHLVGRISAARWAPDGRQLAFLFIQGTLDERGATGPAAPDSGVVSEVVHEQRIACVSAAGGAARAISDPGLFVYEYDWAPDGHSFAATAAHGVGEANWWIAKLYRIDAHSGYASTLYAPRLQIAEPRWSPDGKRIAFIGGLMSDFGSTGGDVYEIPGAPAQGGKLAAAVDITPGLHASATDLSWIAPNRLIVSEAVDGGSAIEAIDPDTHHQSTLWRGDESLHAHGRALGISLSRDGSVGAAVRESFRQPPEIWAGPLDKLTRLTHRNATVHPRWGAATSLHWQSDGARVQGWLLAPPQVAANRHYPLIVYVHGGPAAAWRASFPSTAGMLAARGYFVLMPNPRGSFGAGEAFTRANVRDFGHGDLRDILAGVDEAVRAAPIDPKRVGITGWSYGGYMTMWALTQTRRFAAAVAGAGISNWQSYYGENRINQWMLPYFGASVYDEPAVYARSSPIDYIERVHTPTLILQGERDAEVPAPQAYEYWRALKTLGVATTLVIYPGEGHHFEQPAHQRDRTRRMLEWFDRYLGAKSTEAAN